MHRHMNLAPYILHYAPDNASLVIRLALEETGANYKTLLVDRRSQAQRSPEYLALNPNGLIPVLETPQGPIFETGAILLWLSERHAGLAPSPEASDRADFLKWLFFLSNTLHPALRTLFYPAFYIGAQPADQVQLQRVARRRIKDYLRRLDTRWNQASAIPLALNLYLAPMLRWLVLYPAKTDCSWFVLSDYPGLRSAARSLEKRPSVLRAGAAEGLGEKPFTCPQPPNPPEGSAL